MHQPSLAATNHPDNFELQTSSTRHSFVERLALIALILIGYAIRLLWVHDPGCVEDSRSFSNWMRSAAQGGIQLLLENEKTAYPPATMVTIWTLGELLSPQDPDTVDATLAEMIGLRLLTVHFDILIIALAYRIGRSTRSWIVALGSASLYAVNPVAIYLSGWWGQIEAWFMLPLILALWSLSKRKSALAWAMFTLAVLLKQPAIIAMPLAIVATYRWGGWQKLGIGLTIFVSGILVSMTPIMLSGKAELFLARLAATRKIFPWISLRSYNLWYLLTSRARSIGLDLNHDHGAYIGGISFHDWGLVLFALGYAILLTRVLIKAKLRDLFAAAGVCWMVYFSVSTRIHARYLYPAMVLFLFASRFDRRWLRLHLVLTVTAMLNIFSRACEISPSTCIEVLPTSAPLSLMAAATNTIALGLTFLMFFRQTRDTAAWTGIHAIRRHSTLLRLAWALFAGLAVLSAYEANRLHAQASEVTVILTKSLDKCTRESQETGIVVNYPREISASHTGLWQKLPVTIPSLFLTPQTESETNLVYVQYVPWQHTVAKATEVNYIQYQGRLATWTELSGLVRRANTVIVVNPYSNQAYNLTKSIPKTPSQTVSFDDNVTLTEANAVMGDHYVIVELGWNASKPVAPDTAVFVHLVNETGALIAQSDSAPGRALFQFDYLADSGITLKETRVIPAPLAPTEAWVGLYETASQHRLPIACTPEQLCTDNALRIPIRTSTDM